MDAFNVSTKIVAGGVAGASETLVTFPAEFAKTRRQLHFHNNGRGIKSPAPAPSSLAIVRSTIRTQGITGLYTGCAALVASNAGKSGIRFLAFETTRTRLDQFVGTNTTTEQPRAPWINVVSGASAGVAESVLVVTPGEAVKTNMIHNASAGAGRFTNRGLFGVVGALVREKGVQALWKGLAPIVCKQGTNSAVRFTTFAMLQERVTRWWPGLDGSLASTLVLGGISGVFTVYASMPFDNIKTRIQSADSQYKSMLDCARKTVQVDGIRALWRGTSPRLVRLTFSSGITFAVYEQVVRMFSFSKAGVSSDNMDRLS